MEILGELVRNANRRKDGRTLCRDTVRAIILDGRKILLIHSTVNGDYLFPGGGIEQAESHFQALEREVQEECGIQNIEILREFGTIVEYADPWNDEYDVFKITSHYYLCSAIESGVSKQRLEAYEQDLGLHPVWIDIDQALDQNQHLLQSTQRKIPPWMHRETMALELVKKKLFA